MRGREHELIFNRGELALVERIRRRAKGPSIKGLRLGIGDDCALLRLKPGEELAVTTDLSIAGRHFRPEWHPAAAVGHRALARGLSDIAAMGARPVAAFLSLGLPPELTVGRGRRTAWIDGFLDGFFALASRYRVPLAGGDLAESPIAVADIVLLGAVPQGTALLRSGAQPGDLIYVTGSLGGAAAGLEKLGRLAPGSAAKLKAGDRDELAPHLWPEPRIAQGMWLRNRLKATAAIDLSDGLSTDLDHVCEESNVSAEVDADAIPVARGATITQALHGGEDYELLFTARPDAEIPVRIAGVPVTRIGRIKKRRADRPRVVLIHGSIRGSRPEPLKRQGWEHFS